MSEFISCRVAWDCPFARQTLVTFWQRFRDVVEETFATFSSHVQPLNQTLDAADWTDRCLETVGRIVESDGRAACESIDLWTTPFEISRAITFVLRLPNGGLEVDFCRYSGCYTTEAFQLRQFFPDRVFGRFGVAYDSTGETMRQRFPLVDTPSAEFDDGASSITFPDRELLWSLVGRIASSQFELIRDLFPVTAIHVDHEFRNPDFMLH